MKRPPILTYLCSSLLVWGCVSSAFSQEIPAPALPNIPDKVFTLTDYGAKGDGTSDNTEALKKAIAAVKEAGGGRLVVPAGRYVTYPFTLVSKLDLHLDKDAVVLMPNDISVYPKEPDTYTDWITAKKCTDLAITGEGKFDGQGKPWWEIYKKVNGVAPKGLLHRPQMFRLVDCDRVLIKDVHMVDSPNFHLIPQRCDDVTIDHITIKSPEDAPNTDGIDPSGHRIHVKNCLIDTGDDNVVLKPQVSRHPGEPSCKDVLVENCTFLEGHGMSIGGQTPAGCVNLLVRNCTWEGTDAGIRLKAPRGDGGLVENLRYENLKMKNVKVPVYFTSYYPSIPKDLESDPAQPINEKTPIWRNITITNLTVTDSPEAGRILGIPEMPIENVTFTNCQFNNAKGFRIAYAKGIVFKDSSVKVQKGPAVSVHKVDVVGVETTPAK